MALKLHPTLFLPDTAVLGPTPSNILQYEVLGLPPEFKALIRKKDGHWQLLRVKNNVPGRWDGVYATPEAALAVLATGLICE